MIEPEMAFADLNTNADLAEAFLQGVISEVLEECAEDLQFCEGIITNKNFLRRSLMTARPRLITTLRSVVETPFVRITYTDAIKILNQSGQSFEHSTDWGEALQTEHERFLAEKHFKAPVIITDYPASFKSFMYLNEDGQTVRAMDVIVPRIGEIIGGSQREDRLDVLEERIRHHNLDPQDYWWYSDLRKYGTVPHAGFGLGFERLVMYVSGFATFVTSSHSHERRAALSFKPSYWVLRRRPTKCQGKQQQRRGVALATTHLGVVLATSQFGGLETLLQCPARIAKPVVFIGTNIWSVALTCDTIKIILGDVRRARGIGIVNQHGIGIR